jgi:hypothetical protein
MESWAAFEGVRTGGYRSAVGGGWIVGDDVKLTLELAAGGEIRY